MTISYVANCIMAVFINKWIGGCWVDGWVGEWVGRRAGKSVGGWAKVRVDG